MIPNDRGRVTGASAVYVAGWIKRGPQGVIGTNKADAGETVDALLEDLAAGRLVSPEDPSPASIDKLVRNRVPHAVSWEDWRAIDEAERTAGAADGRPRRKFAAVQAMLEVLRR